MGFAVVADEVRNLAQRSAAAAKETAAKVEGAMNCTNQGVEIGQQVAAALSDIVAKSGEVEHLAAEVAESSRNQSSGIAEINAAVVQMNTVTQNNAAAAEETASAAQELNGQAHSMAATVRELSQLVGGKKSNRLATQAKSSLNPPPTTPMKRSAPARQVTPPIGAPSTASVR
jgi:methyl-accepting chemotaxis protein